MIEKLRDLGPAPIDEPEKGLPPKLQPGVNAAPTRQAKPRHGPKLGLEGMTHFLMDIVIRGTMHDGSFAGECWVRLEAADLEKLQDIADTLDYFRIQRMHSRIEQGRKR